ncbi:MAG TPA: hypothetical protein VMH87_06990 [Pseudomonadales bacterium]|nr:hypothetical protein [Pseudomonadales bacterium]
MSPQNRLRRPFTKAENHFGQGISAGRLRIGDDDATQVLLEGDWPELVRSLGQLGEVVATTNNPAVSLSQTGIYPHFRTCPCKNPACSLNRGLVFDFSAWQEVWAARRKADDGIWRTLTIADSASASHQILFPAEAGDERFTQLISKFVPAKPASYAASPRFLRSSMNHRPQASLTQPERFRQRKREFIESKRSGARAIHPESMPEIWRNILAERLHISTVAVTAPVVHPALWQPVSLSETSGILAVASRNTFFRCQLAEISEIWAVPHSREAETLLTLEVYDAQDSLFFALAGAPEEKVFWHELLQWLPTA